MIKLWMKYIGQVSFQFLSLLKIKLSHLWPAGGSQSFWHDRRNLWWFPWYLRCSSFILWTSCPSTLTSPRSPNLPYREMAFQKTTVWVLEMLLVKLDIVSRTCQWNKLGNIIDLKLKHLIKACWHFLFKLNTRERLLSHFLIAS